MRLAASAFLPFAALCVGLQAQQPYYPGAQWRTATPESQGIDSTTLTDALDQVTEKGLGVHSLLVIRHGYVVADAYFYPYAGSAPHDLASVTKTITSTLTGVAVGRGLVRLDDKLLPFFPREAPADPAPAKQRITVGDLVRMESGLDCGYAAGEQELEQMKRSPDWVGFALALPMKYDPGTHSSYCSPGYHLLGSALAAAARQTERDFAMHALFEPLGIHEVVWAADPQGRSHGWGDCHLFPADLARIGYLFLHDGEWNGHQIVPRDWVAHSIAPPAAPRGEVGGMGYEWNASNGPSGRQYGGIGRGGQSLIVWPDLDMVVVSMAGGNNGQVMQGVRQAVKAETALAANPEAVRRLHKRIAAVALPPVPNLATALPALGRSISGSVYEFPVNPSRLDSLSLDFENPTQAHVTVKYYGEPLTFGVGLDGIYRLSRAGPMGLPGGARGKWTSDHEFLLDLNFVANINHYTLAIAFEGDRIEVAADETSGLIRKGHLIGTRKSSP
jgi:CubicO group peptidase (beta-lactamase class C family)